MNREFRKVYVDSRLRYTGSGSNFSVELTDSVELPDGWSMWVSAVTFPNSWYTVDGNNDKFYFMIEDPVAVTAQIVLIPYGKYTHDELATAIQGALTAASSDVTVTSNPNNTFTFTAGDQETIRIPSRFELTSLNWKLANWDAAAVTSPYDYTSPGDLNFMLNPFSSSPPFAATFDTPIVDLAPHNVLYLHSNLTNYGSIDSAGRKSVIASILIDKEYGSIIHLDHRGLDADSVDISNRRFKNMSFQLKNVYGQVVDLRGGDMSIELCFGPTK